MEKTKTLTEYLSSVRSELTRTTWHFTPDQAARIVLNNIDSLLKAFAESVPAWYAAAEIGFDR